MRSQPPLTATTTGGARRRRGVLASVAVGTLALGVLVATPAQAAPVTIDVYGFNDFHGRLERGSAPRDGEQGVAGAATMAAAFAQYRAANPNSIFVSSGDNVGASTFTSFIQDDAPTLTALNQMGLDVSAIGNHEFDKGQADLRDRIEEAADFEYLAANVVDATTKQPAFTPYTIEERGGKRIAFIGAVTELMPELVSPTGIEGLEFTDIVDSVNRYATALTNGRPDPGITGGDEADAVVLLVHEGGETNAVPTDASTAWGNIVLNTSPSVDAILSAHTHQQYDYAVTPTNGTTERPVIQTGSYSGALSHLQFSFDDQDVAVKSVRSVGNIDLYRTTFASGSPEEAEVAATVAEAVRVAQVQGARRLGEITGPFLRAVQPDGKTPPGTTENRGGESTAGNFVADVQLAATRANGAQMAFMNPGGLRADLVGTAGVVNYQQAAAVQPFANTLVVVDMTGAQVEEALEQQWQPAGSSRPFLKLGASKGLVYTYDPAAAQGERITSITLDGVALDPAETYKVTVNSFLAGGGDNFGAFDQDVKADSGKVDLQAQVEYFEANERVSPDFAQRAVGVQMTPAPAEGFAPGDEVTLQLSSLVFSQAAPGTGPVSVSLDGVELASSDIDATLVPTNDEQGRATLTFTVPEQPAAAPGEVSTAAVQQRALVVRVAGTGTEVQVPIALAVADVVPVDPGTGAPTDPTVPGAPADPAAPGAGAPGAGSGSGAGSATAGRGPLAFTGSDATAGGLLAALALLLAGAGALTATRLRRRAVPVASDDSTD